MSFSTKTNKTVKDLYLELSNMGSRFLYTIPYGSEIEKANGFISVTGKGDELPVLTMCVNNPISGRAIVSTIVFPSEKIYSKLVESLLVDLSVNFNGEESNEDS